MEAGERAGDEVSEDAASPRKKAWLSSLTIGDYPGLEGEITIDLSPRCTVLVGRNGAGKSLLLDAIESVTKAPSGDGKTALPGRFQCTISAQSRPDLRYEYSRTHPARKSSRGKVKGPTGGLRESGWKELDGEWKPLWRYESGLATLDNGVVVRATDGFLKHAHDSGPPDAIAIADALNTMFRIRSGVPREQHTREEIFHRLALVDGHVELEEGNEQSSRLHALSYELAIEGLGSESEIFFEVSEAATRVGVARAMRVSTYESRRKQEKSPSPGVCEVVVDDVNIGLLADGSLRVLETLLVLHNGYFQGDLILLEEPETGIHPGLLARLLREIESYEGQVIISTHSPQVVSWAKPTEIRLVERQIGKTTVRSLTPSEIERVHEYLSHDGTLGEFVYGGALDGEE